tara:strand:+ start:1544 stop:1870 length:327 start_codon:yes stop_codon:yes gene_type:complete
MPEKITFTKNIQNISLQVGDIAYYVTPDPSGYNSTFNIIGEVTAVGKDFIVVPTNPGLTQNDFVMFSKNKAVNNSSLLGYYAEVKLSNNSTQKAELFSISSEVTQSSK